MAGVTPTTRLERRVLGFCNRIRKELGKKPRKTIEKGTYAGARTCPIALTIGDRASLTSNLHVGGHTYECPQYVFTFMERFDSGRLSKFLKTS